MALNDNNQAARVDVVAPLSSDLILLDRDGATGRLYATALAIAQLAGGGGGGVAFTFDTGIVANGASAALGPASPGHIYLVFAMDKLNTDVVGMWIVFGTAAINTFLGTGCALSIVGVQMTLTNNSGGPIDFIGAIQTIL
jgi:hypothetical protein